MEVKKYPWGDKNKSNKNNKNITKINLIIQIIYPIQKYCAHNHLLSKVP